MMEALDAFSSSVRDLDAVLTRLEAKVDALPTREWIRVMIVREVARMTVLVAAVAAAGTLALCLVER